MVPKEVGWEYIHVSCYNEVFGLKEVPSLDIGEHVATVIVSLYSCSEEAIDARRTTHRIIIFIILCICNIGEFLSSLTIWTEDFIGEIVIRDGSSILISVGERWDDDVSHIDALE